MKILTDHAQPVSRQEQTGSKPKVDQQGFGEALAREVGKTETPPAVARPSPPPPGARTMGVNPLLSVEEAARVEGVKTAEHTVMEHIEIVLDKWEKYADTLKGSGASQGLKPAFDALQNVSGEVERLKGALPSGLGERHPGLRTMVDELEAMTVTEQFKFNRGDYL